jgi:hypothetical protein
MVASNSCYINLIIARENTTLTTHRILTKTQATVAVDVATNRGFVNKGSILFDFKPGKNITLIDFEGDIV